MIENPEIPIIEYVLHQIFSQSLWKIQLMRLDPNLLNLKGVTKIGDKYFIPSVIGKFSFIWEDYCYIKHTYMLPQYHLVYINDFSIISHIRGIKCPLTGISCSRNFQSWPKQISFFSTTFGSSTKNQMRKIEFKFPGITYFLS